MNTGGNNYVDNSTKLPTVISFCSGYGGIERGLDLAGFKHRVIAYVEIEAFAIENLATKMENKQLDAAPIWSNLKTFPTHVFRDKVSLITGGYPCQPFSAAGERKGAEDPRHLWPFIREHIRAIRPTRVFFENVEGHISLGLREVINDLESLDYVCAWGIFSAREVGAPHQRKRVYIMGHSQNNRLSRGSKNAERQGSADICKRSDKDLRSKSQRSGQALADAISEGPQGSSECRPDTREAKAGTKGAYGNFRCLLSLPRNVWPSRPSEDQHSWEASRTLKPRVGRTTDGCPDRVDRIRLLGNAVVPQTAAKAWITLGERL